ncbi:DNA polymerase III subunit delta' [Psychrobacter sp. I-STPA10]|uniref:DNA polymerase III subunit delta' n=1 Tax=Psychrobacter sp. I-STPA10 TaxID=2585769 RepID=UPI001E5205E8|nr:DNA polymerase III subunit delta' [Psychrobacter sp. I-STPA10]
MNTVDYPLVNHEMVANSPYFAPLLPWQQELWQRLTMRVDRLPHGLLFAGMAGIGKHAFVWRLIAWLLCHNRGQHAEGACGCCDSCLWLASATHPDLIVLPQESQIIEIEAQDADGKGQKKNLNQSSKSMHKKVSSADNTAIGKIKVDDIRALQPFVNQGSHGRRICVIDYADTMTVAAANALLKTLEEPKAGVYLILISDRPAKLLATIKSRVQQIPITQFSASCAQTFLTEQIIKQQQIQSSKSSDRVEGGQPEAAKQIATQLLAIADGAPLKALAFFDAPWYGLRQLWLITWRALQYGKRSSIAASDYWQTQLDLTDFLQLTQVMINDLQRLKLGIAPKQQDIDFEQLTALMDKPFEKWIQLQHNIDDMKISIGQNVQEKLIYDELMQQLATI